MSLQMELFSQGGAVSKAKGAAATRVGDDRLAKLAEELSILTEAENGPRCLREIILELAVRGRLGTTMANDEPADALLRRLDGQEQEEVEQGIFDLPTGWCWARFSSVATIASNLVDPANHLDLPHVAPDGIEKGTGRLIGYRTVREDGVTSGKHRFFPGQILYSKIRPNLSKVVTIDFDGVCSADMYPVTAKIDTRYLHTYMLSPAFFAQVVKEDNRLAMPKVNQQQLNAVLVAVPPLAEQKRIVAKVDQLMALCDELEAKQAKQRELGDRLTKASLGALSSAEGPEELATAWTRVAENFEALIDRPEAVDEMRQAAIWLATHGRLGTAHPGDEDAKVLLARVRKGRRDIWEARRLEEMRVAGNVPRGDAWKSKYKAADLANPEDPLVNGLPEGWSIATLGEIAEVIDPNPSHRYPSYANGSIPLLSTREFRGRDSWDTSGADVPRVPPDVYVEQNDRCRFAPNDIILARKGRLGLARHSPPLPAYVFSHTLFVIKVSEQIEPDYVLWFLRLNAAIQWLRQEMNDNTGVPTLGKTTTERLPVPLPPVAEQRRIVAKVDQLMKLCDDLEAKLRTRDEKAAKLAEALVAEIVG